MTMQLDQADFEKINRAIDILQRAGLKHKLPQFDTMYGAIALAITILAFHSNSTDELNDGIKALEEWFQFCVKKASTILSKRQSKAERYDETQT
jgi:hypothetical protein